MTTLNELSAIRSPLLNFGNDEVFDLIFEANPDFPRENKDHFNMFLRVEVENGKSVNRVVLKVKDDASIRSFYKNPDKELVFTINQHDIKHVMDRLNLPDEIVVETLKEFDEQAAENLREFSRLFYNWDNVGNSILFKNKQDSRKLAVVFLSPREVYLSKDGAAYQRGFDGSEEDLYQIFLNKANLLLGKGEGHFDVSGVRQTDFFSVSDEQRQQAISLLTREGYGDVLSDFEVHTSSRQQLANVDFFGYAAATTLDMVKELTCKVIWVRSAEEVDQKDLDDFVTNNNLNVALNKIVEGLGGATAPTAPTEPSYSEHEPKFEDVDE